MLRTSSVTGFLVFLMTIGLIWFGGIIVNYLCILYWFAEPDISKRLISLIPCTHIGTVIFVIFNSLGYLTSVAHVRASLVDPGVVTSDISPPGDFPKEEVKGCKKCNLKWKPIRAHHCSECNVCILKMDHHWPWINSWVGIRNTKYFFLFTLYTGTGALLSIAIIVTSFILMLQDQSNSHVNKPGYPIAFFLWICTLILAVLFSFFTLELVGEQLESFQDNQTYVDDLKDLIGMPLTLTESFRVWIGEDWALWLLPTRPVLKMNYWERLYKMQEIVSKKYKEYEDIDYDPSGKLKAIERSNAKTDRIYFAIFTAVTFGVTYCTASMLQ
jgi:hypothetical protein